MHRTVHSGNMITSRSLECRLPMRHASFRSWCPKHSLCQKHYLIRLDYIWKCARMQSNISIPQPRNDRKMEIHGHINVKTIGTLNVNIQLYYANYAVRLLLFRRSSSFCATLGWRSDVKAIEDRFWCILENETVPISRMKSIRLINGGVLVYVYAWRSPTNDRPINVWLPRPDCMAHLWRFRNQLIGCSTYWYFHQTPNCGSCGDGISIGRTRVACKI